MVQRYLFSVLLFALVSMMTRAEQPRSESRTVPNRHLVSGNPEPPSPARAVRVDVSSGECLSLADMEQMKVDIRTNIERLKLQRPGLLQRRTQVHPLFAWPVRSKAGFSDYGYYTVQNFVDHDWGFPNLLEDWNCGMRTYDIEPGTFRGINGLDHAALGIPGERDYVRRYCERVGRATDHALDADTVMADWNFYLAYNLFRLASITQGIAKRVVDGTAASAQARATGAATPALARMAWSFAQASR